MYIGPKIINNNLVLSLDAANTNSFKGEPTTNLLLNVDDWSSNWTGNLFGNWINSTVTANSDYSPEATLTATKLTGGYSRFQRLSCSTNTTYTFSLWIKNINLGVDPILRIAFGLNNSLVSYNVSTTISRSTITNWRRVSITYTTPSSGINQMEVGVDYSGDYPNNNSVLVWHAMCEQKSYATPFVNGTRGATLATGGGWLDKSRNNNHGTLVNNPTYTTQNLGTVLFDGVNEYINIPTFTNKPTTQITCEAWIKPTRGSVGTGTIRGGAISCTNTMYLGIIDSSDGGNTFSLHFANQTSNSRLYNWNGSIPNNAWTYIAGTYDGNTSRAFINGVEVSSWAQTGTITDGTYVIGTYGQGLTDGLHNFNGHIGKARIYNKALTSVEINQNYKSTKARFGL